jgi:hypothetical protein
VSHIELRWDIEENQAESRVELLEHLSLFPGAGSKLNHHARVVERKKARHIHVAQVVVQDRGGVDPALRLNEVFRIANGRGGEILQGSSTGELALVADEFIAEAV